MREKTAELQVAWMSWGFCTLLMESFVKYQPNLSSLFPTMQSSVMVKSLFLSITLLGSLFLGALFFSASGIPKDGSCSDLNPRLESISVSIYSALFKSGIIFWLGWCLKKAPLYDHVTPDLKKAQIRAWRRRENMSCFFGVTYCLGCCLYTAAFSMVISPEAFDSYLQANMQSFFLLLLFKPAIIALVLAFLLASPKKTLVAAFAPSFCDFSHKTGLPFAERCRIQQFMAAAPLGEEKPTKTTESSPEAPDQAPDQAPEKDSAQASEKALEDARGANAELPLPGAGKVTLQTLVGAEVVPPPILHTPREPQPRPWNQVFRCNDCSDTNCSESLSDASPSDKQLLQLMLRRPVSPVD
jgi:hypothetical protein